MTKQDAKKIPLPALLRHLGCRPDPARATGKDRWFSSPFRPEEPDFKLHVHAEKNIWYDFGAPRPHGGDIFQLLMLLQNCDFAAALRFLEQFAATLGPPTEPVETTAPPPPAAEPLILESVSTVFSPSLFQYLREECRFNLAAAREYLRQVHFTNRAGKKFFGAGLQNRSGGWEVRNPYFQGSIGQRDFTALPGRSGAEVSVFAGMFDFLAGLTFFGKNILFQNDVLVLNTPAVLPAATDFLLKKTDCRVVKLFLPNTPDGQKAVENFKNSLPEKIIEPSFALYLEHESFFEFLVKDINPKSKIQNPC